MLIIFLFIILCHTVFADVSCRNENGEPVDWFYLYKLPQHNSKHIDSTGLHYLYMSSEDANPVWKLSEKLINNSYSFPGQTLAPIWNDSAAFFIAYNDENPNGHVDFENGHTKGIVSADAKTGFWLIHSVPKYPDTKTPYNYPKNGLHYGQSFLCITMASDQMKLVGKQLIFNEPYVYDSRLPTELNNLYPFFDNVINMKWKKDGPFWNEIKLKSLGGIWFQSFAKSGKFLKELYEDWVAPVLDVDLLVETWRLGPGNLNSNCTKKHHVLNVKEIEDKTLDIAFKTTTDHSKWAVSQKNSWICIGDINRQEHQLMRGGGTVCQLNDDLANAYRNLVQNVENCPKQYGKLLEAH